MKNSTIYWRLMRITLLQVSLAMVLCGVALAHNNYGQGLLDTKVSIRYEGQSLKKVLSGLEKEASVKFAYSSSYIDLAKKITLSADHSSLKDVLDELLPTLSINFELRNNYILLSPAKEEVRPSVIFSEEKGSPFYLISGKVTDALGASIPGVNILIKGTTTGTTSDATGAYNLSAEATDYLVFSFIGYKTTEVLVGNRTVIDMSLEEDVSTLTEVVVTGYTTQSRAEFTGSSSSLNVADIQRPVPNFTNSLAGQAAGVNVITSGGQLNSAPVFRIRGTNSIQLSSYPLIIIDGVTSFTDDVGNSADNNPLSNLNPNDIESMEILKDASATAIYGSRAANGVVVITTKKGKEGKAKFSYDGWVGWNTRPPRLPNVLNAEDYVTIKNEARANMGLAPAFFLQENPDGSIVDTDWYDYAYQTGSSQNHSLSVSGGSSSTSYFMSLGYTDQEGFMVKNTFERTSVRANLTHKLTNWLSMGTNISYTNSLNSDLTSGGAFSLNNLARMSMVLPPNLKPLNDDGTYNTVGNSIGYGANTITTGYYNPLPLVEHDKFTSQSDGMIGLAYLEAEVLKGLKLKTNYSLNLLNALNSSFNNPYQAGGFANNGAANKSTSVRKRTDWTNTLNYATSIASQHNISFMVGTQKIYTVTESFGVNVRDLADPFYNNFYGSWNTLQSRSASFGENGYLSYFSSATYDFRKKYLFTASFRRDGFSGLAKGNKFGNFGGLSLGWNISEESFYSNSPLASIMTDLKLRGSYGQVGNVNIGNYDALDLYSTGLYADLTSTLGPNQTGNADLRWETSKKTDVGFNAAFFDSKISLDVDYYKNNIDGMILNALQAPSKGIPGNSITSNVGKMSNTGWEFELDYKAINRGDFKWTVGVNFSTNKNEVTELSNDNADIWSGGLETSNITRVGESIASVYVVETTGVNPENGMRMYLNASGETVQYNPEPGATPWTYLDGSVATAMQALADGKIYGPSSPTFFGGVNSTLTYKSFDLLANFTFSGGNKMYNGTRASLLDNRFFNNIYDIERRWTTPGQVTDIPKLHYNDQYASGSVLMHSGNVEDAGFLKLRNVSLGYKVPGRVYSGTGISNVRVYASATNFILLTKYTGIDPEISANGDSNTSAGRDKNQMPAGRAFTLGINIGF